MNLIALNRNFYNAFAEEFSRSRGSINPGIMRALNGLDLSAVLDVGCGDGRVSKALPEACQYVGLDFSVKLIGRNAKAAAGFALADLSSPLPVAGRSFPTVICFAALHHLPERLLAMRELARVAKQPGGRVAVSVWQITHNARMSQKIVEDLGNGDYVLDWERGGRGERFVHEVTETELTELAEGAGLRVVEMFRADGWSGDLGLYAILAS